MRLNVGDRIYAIHYDNIIAVYTIERTTKNADDASVTFRGVGKAMAEQWGVYVLKKEWERMSRWERVKTSIRNII